MQIIDSLISRRVLNPEKQITIPCQEKSIVTVVQEVLVWRKRARTWMVSNEINDGAQVATLQERPILVATIDPIRLLHGMSLYQEYDEVAASITTYLYRFSKTQDAFSRVQSFLETHTPGYHLAQEGRFVVLQGEQATFPDTEKLLVELTHAGHSGLVSFLCGLVMAYGNIDTEDDVLHTMHVSIPLVGSLAQRAYLIDHVVMALADLGVFIQQNVQNQHHGQVMQLMITDWEILHLLRLWLGDSFGLASTSKYDTYQSMKADLLQFLEEETNDQQLIDKVACGVVKLLRK